MGFVAVLFALASIVCAPRLSHAGKTKLEPAPSAAPAASTAEDEAATPDPADVHFIAGPSSVDLGHSLTLALPAADRFLGAADADKVLKKMGNLRNDGVLGIVAPKDGDADWFAVVDWVDDGHVDDSEAIDAKKLLEEMRDGLKEANPERVKQGFKELAIDGFEVEPAYDKARHHLSWALIVSDSDGKSVNLNTRILGRTTYVSIDLVTDPAKLEAYRGEAMTLLDATSFTSGQRYEDFDKKKDKVAEYGLAGLIAGGVGLGALKLVKLGLLAKFWNVILAGLLAAKKALVLGIAAIAAWFKRMFGKKKEGGAPLAPATKSPDASGPPPRA